MMEKGPPEASLHAGAGGQAPPAGAREGRWLSVTGGMLWCTLAVVLIAYAAQAWSQRSGQSWKLQREASAEAPAPSATRWRVDINQASAAELTLLPGIGPVRARRIIEERERGGPFSSALSVSRVKGIGPKTAQRLAPFVAIGPEGAAQAP